MDGAGGRRAWKGVGMKDVLVVLAITAGLIFIVFSPVLVWTVSARIRTRRCRQARDELESQLLELEKAVRERGSMPW